jgi:hypothetical protein
MTNQLTHLGAVVAVFGFIPKVMMPIKIDLRGMALPLVMMPPSTTRFHGPAVWAFRK